MRQNGFFNLKFALPFNPKNKSNMRFRVLLSATIFAISGFFSLIKAQNPVILFYEDFNSCVLPAGWQVKIEGNQNPVWRVGYFTNPQAVGLSIDSTCCLLVDDDQTGDNTPAYQIDFVSPPFDASQFPTVALLMDVHYRDWNEANEYFDILVTDGVKEYLVAHYDQYKRNGESINEHFEILTDLSVLTQSSQCQIIIRYNDGGGFAWWAAVDNIIVAGLGEGENVVAESFNDCAKPAGWETEIVSGDFDWNFGILDTASKGYSSGPTMNGSCFAFFDDDLIGDTAAYSIVRMYTPWFDGSQFGKYQLEFDLIHRYYKEHIRVLVQHENGEEFTVAEAAEDVGGPYFPNYVHVPLDLSPFRDRNMRVCFEYWDGNSWGWWTGIDNVKITGSGAANDLCAQAILLQTAQPCTAGDNSNAIFEGPTPACGGRVSSGLWYRWTADFSGYARISTGAKFNDLVSVFTGNCASPQPIVCDNRDEHGFTGETTIFQVQNGTDYLIRVSGLDEMFGVARGALCIRIDPTTALPVKPANDNCAGAQALLVNANCQNGNNLNADNPEVLPSVATLARADVWYRFVAPAVAANEHPTFYSGATFSDIIAVYSGGCGALQEVAATHHGGALPLPGLTAGQTYYVQVAGNFATIEGSLCPRIAVESSTAPANDNCLNAASLNIGGACTAGTNGNATPSGYTPACVPNVAADIWYRFTAPSGGAVRLNTGAEFEHVVGVWEGDCNALKPVYCVENPLRCNGFVTIPNLIPGKNYFLQIATRNTVAAPGLGALCVKLLDISAQPDFTPIQVEIKEFCLGNGVAQVTYTIQDGVPPYQTNGVTNGQELNAGTPYLLVVKDALNCEVALNGVADDCNIACALALNATQSDPACHDLTNGSINVEVSAGASPFAFLWSNGSESNPVQDLAAGTYTVTVTDANGCAAISTYTLNNPPAIVIGNIQVTNPTVGQTNGSIKVSISGGTAPYGITWMRGQAIFVMGGEELNSLPPGEYQLIVVDAKGCMQSYSFTLTETVSTNAPDADIQVQITPNPADVEALIFVKLKTTADLNCALYDAAGRVLHAWSPGRLQQWNGSVPVKELPDGVYQLRIIAGETVLARNVVVAH